MQVANCLTEEWFYPFKKFDLNYFIEIERKCHVFFYPFPNKHLVITFGNACCIVMHDLGPTRLLKH